MSSKDGLNELLRISSKAPHIAAKAMERTMRIAKDLCQETTAFRDETGNLRRSIDAGVVEYSETSVVGALSAGYPDHGDSARYAGWVELGHGGRAPAPPHPYIAPTMRTVDGMNVIAMEWLSELAAVL